MTSDKLLSVPQITWVRGFRGWVYVGKGCCVGVLGKWGVSGMILSYQVNICIYEWQLLHCAIFLSAP